MSDKKRPPFWFEEPMDDSKRPQDNFFEGIEKMFCSPGVVGRVIKFPNFRTNFIPVKIAETQNELLLRANIPGFKKDEIRLKVTPHLVYISAEKKSVNFDRGDDFASRSSSSSTANRILELPREVNTNGVRARYEKGVLEVVMKKRFKGRQKEVNVE
jgi:HSP20 family protein